ncbi:hypothetical protein WICPIJ_008942 [Wickerhamomyces pijperi]|uniref:Uncharacterized protein n=1 Tax=Wickerhamomyces pijperi TaxID=599730 RepID=A0A9P8PSL9_WICPI|nr:hypothetical protein WICPIJ_008942 [Wickerhamomyces pijperi]
MAHNKFLHSVQEALKIIENIPIDSHLSLEFAHEPYNPNIYQTMQLLPLIEGVFEESKISSFHIDVFKQYCKFNRLTKARDGYQGIFEVFADVKLQYLRGTKHLRFDIAELVCDLSIPDNKTNGQKVEPMRLLAWFEKSGQSDFKHKCLNASNGLIRSVNMVCSNDLLLEEARDEPVTITGEQLKELNKKMLEISISLQKFEETPRSSDIVKALEKSFQVIRYRPAWSIEYVIRNLIFLKDLCNCEERPKEIERIWMQVMTLS